MAILTKSLFGNLSGKCGDKIYYTRNGKTHVRDVPAKRTKPPTPKQLEQQYKFRLVAALMAVLKPLIKIGFKPYCKKRSSTSNTAFKFNYKALERVGDSWCINYSKVSLSRGIIYGYLDNAQVTYEGDGMMAFCWDVSPLFHANCLACCFYNATKQKVVFLEAYFPVNVLFLHFPFPEEDLGDEIHAWTFAIDDYKNEVSNTKYLGQFTADPYRTHFFN